MTELVINGQQVTMKENISFKLTVANPCFTDSDEFTYDVELPLNILRNSRVFGNIDRFDVDKNRGKEFTARLIVDNVIVLNGKAVITAITDTSVKVQLMGERTAYNYDSTANGNYIDKMQLGQFVTTDDGYSPTPPSNNSTTGNRGSHAGTSDTTGSPNAPVMNDPQDRWVHYPILNTTNDEVINDFIAGETGIGTREYKLVVASTGYHRDADYMRRRIAKQPMLWWVCERIAEASGYTLEKEDNEMYNNPFYRRIFIANAYPTTRLCRILPHWTVSEFWANLQKAFGVIVTIVRDNIRIVPRSQYLSMASGINVIEKAEDAYSCDIEEDEATDISSSNVAFAAFDHDPCDLLDDTVLESARIDSSFADIEELRNWWLDLAPIRRSAYRDTLFKCKDGREYIYFRDRFDSPRFMQVNQFASRIVNPDSDSYIEIKFVPCSFYEHELVMADRWNDRDGFHYAIVEGVSTPVEILGRPDRDSDTRYSTALEEIIEGETSAATNDGEDVIYLGIKNSMTSETLIRDSKAYGFSYPYPNSRERKTWLVNEDSFLYEHAGNSLSLNKEKGSITLEQSTLGDGLVIDSTVKYCVKFISEEIPDTTRLFNIRNRLFACEKLEATVDANGLQPLVTGYFFPVKL